MAAPESKYEVTIEIEIRRLDTIKETAVFSVNTMVEIAEVLSQIHQLLESLKKGG